MQFKAATKIPWSQGLKYRRRVKPMIKYLKTCVENCNYTISINKPAFLIFFVFQASLICKFILKFCE